MSAYLDCHTSLLAYCKNFLIANSIADFQVFDFESHAATQELPASHLIGITDYSIQNNTDMYDITVMFMVCTLSDDADLKVLRSVVDKLFAGLIPGSQFTLVNPAGTAKGEFTVKDEVMATSIGATKTRPIQGLAVSLGVGYTQLPIV